jgi:hypothetical protein
VTHPRALLRQACRVVDLFLAANFDDSFLQPADDALSEFCESEGADNGAASMAALLELAILTWAEASNVPAQELLERVCRRIDDDGPSPALVRV